MDNHFPGDTRCHDGSLRNGKNTGQPHNGQPRSVPACQVDCGNVHQHHPHVEGVPLRNLVSFTEMAESIRIAGIRLDGIDCRYIVHHGSLETRAVDQRGNAVEIVVA